MQAAVLPGIVRKIRIAVVRGVLLRLGIACLPLVAVLLLCVAMFNGLGKSRVVPVVTTPMLSAPLAPQTAVTAPLLPEAQTTQAVLVEPAQVSNADRPNLIQAAFKRLRVTHATINVPD